MGKSAEKFLELRAENMAMMYPQDFTKKEAVETGKKLVSELLEKGDVDKFQFMASLVRLKEVINSADAEMRKILPEEKTKLYGVEFMPIIGGESLNFSEDEIYNQLELELKLRKELLQLAQKHDNVLDSYGNVVPKVSTTPRKSSITIKF